MKRRSLAFATLALLIHLPLPSQDQARPQGQAAGLELPARCAYCTPDARALRRHADGSVTQWKGKLSYYGFFHHVGKLEIVLRTKASRKSAQASGILRLALQAQPVGKQPAGRTQRRSLQLSSTTTELRFGPFEVKQPGYHRLSLSFSTTADKPAGQAPAKSGPDLRSLTLCGPAAKAAAFSRVERRNAASVHLQYPLPKAALSPEPIQMTGPDSRQGPKQSQAEWIYCELTPKTDPLWTYYEAIGWHRGYFGMQVNSPSERRIIFSVWDAGKEPINRSKVAKENRVQLLAKGPDVQAGGFGHEGTGGHSHLVYNWKLGDSFRFLLHAERVGAKDGAQSKSVSTQTIYSAWFYFPEKHAWGLIASFKAPRDGSLPRGLYSFNENFSGANGQERRVCEFHNQWIRTSDGHWYPLLEARFTHDGHGRKERLDRSAGLRADRFYLANGGFVTDENPSSVHKAQSKLVREQGKQTHPSDREIAELGS